ncbi:hypothetical protein [Streptomyces sp. NPDC005374]|uniref:hypothetical protein n=1 Tax=Streptomyces sp. NPDC005374 TaxID=3364713 RepID=UPI0036C32114
MSRAAACLSGRVLLVAFTGTSATAAPLVHAHRVSATADGGSGGAVANDVFQRRSR